MGYGVFTSCGIDGSAYLTRRDDDSPVVFETIGEAHEWAETNYPSYFDGHPNGWQAYGFIVEEVTV